MPSLEERRVVTVEVAGAVVEVLDVVDVEAVVDVVAVVVAEVVAGALEELIGKSKFWWKCYETN